MHIHIKYGNKTARIKKITDDTAYCNDCKSVGVVVNIYLDYFHIYHIPMMPIGYKKAVIRCNTCGVWIRNERLQDYYSDKARKPIYLYAVFLLIPLVIAVALIAITVDNYISAGYIRSPKAGDIYQVKSKGENLSTYSLLKVAKVKGDSIAMLQNRYEYSKQIVRFNDGDYFIKNDTAFYSKDSLLQMLHNGKIYSVYRTYSNDETGFYREK